MIATGSTPSGVSMRPACPPRPSVVTRRPVRPSTPACTLSPEPDSAFMAGASRFFGRVRRGRSRRPIDIDAWLYEFAPRLVDDLDVLRDLRGDRLGVWVRGQESVEVLLVREFDHLDVITVRRVAAEDGAPHAIDSLGKDHPDHGLDVRVIELDEPPSVGLIRDTWLEPICKESGR